MSSLKHGTNQMDWKVLQTWMNHTLDPFKVRHYTFSIRPGMYFDVNIDYFYCGGYYLLVSTANEE